MYYGYGYGYGMDWTYLLLMIVTMALGLITQGYIRSTYAKWSQVPSPGGRTGAEMARRMLEHEGASSVGIGHVAGRLTDHYDPSNNTLNLSEENFSGGSVASIAVACHEAGHAVQTARGYLPGRIRTAIVPAVNLTQQWWGTLFFLGFLLNMGGLVQLAVILFAFSVVFQHGARRGAHLGHASAGRRKALPRLAAAHGGRGRGHGVPWAQRALRPLLLSGEG